MSENIINILSDGGELLLDSLIENDVIKEIPVLGTSVNLIKGVMSLRDRAYLNKIKYFIEKTGEITEEQRLKLIEKSRKDQKSRMKFGEALFNTIEQSDTVVKMEYLAAIFEAFLNDELTDSELREMCNAINKTYIDDLILIIETDVYNANVYKRCIPSGLITELIKSGSQHGGIGVTGGGGSYLKKTELLNKFKLAWEKYK